ncbi:hypothetical protein ADIS_2864 [Lunatimonas lonarensis]|uniref:histidine kinase n=1 Tax=Lunatimonas lonarensis TaxID=1232681 RepID=R7ZQX4_9BACT|nr:ATP-binding protein [Lunatimonas lonarensis]EON76414.1 hypothetical protein ADIS_2864 [Lunatimonas lonarensis]
MQIGTTTKVFAGFLLAVTLIIVVGITTFFSVKNLLDSVDTLSMPNERLNAYNRLLADIYRLDQLTDLDTSNTDSITIAGQIEQQLRLLEQKSNDPIEIYKLNAIWYNIEELIEVQGNLTDVKLRITNRDFSKEALDNIERKIRRQEERRVLENLDRLSTRIGPSRELNETRNRNSDAAESGDEIRTEPEMVSDEMERVIDYLTSNLETEGISSAAQRNLADSVLLALREYMLEITSEERFLRARLANLEHQLLRKNRELVSYIQEIITSLQYEATRQGRSENENAYQLAYRLSIFLSGLIILGVIGSSAFIFTITREIKKSERYNAKLEEAKLKSEKLATAKQEFLANMSHEIRNPLHVIQGYQEALAKTPMTADQQEFLNLSSTATETLLGVVNDILDFSKLEAGKIPIEQKPFDPNRLFEQSKVLFEKNAKDKGITLTLHTDFPDNKWMIGDVLRISQIMNNLVSNAIKFTEQGDVYISATYAENKGLCIVVKDSGIGMAAEVKERIFTAFDQGDTTITRRFGGTGLGLSIVNKLTILMNGQIHVDSDVGKGTTFTIKLPTALTEPLRAEPVPETNTVSLDGLCILLVDDDSVVLKYTKMLLTALGADVLAFSGGVEWKKRFNWESFDFALLDLQMPEISGFDILEILRNRVSTKHKPVLALTANVFAKEQNAILSRGFNGIILKPFKEAELLESLSCHIPMTNDLKQPSHSTDTMKKPEKPYNLESIAKFAMGDDELIKELVVDFVRQTNHDLVQLATCFEIGEYDRLREITHQLASRLRQFEIKSGDTAKEAELMLKNGQREGLEVLIQVVIRDGKAAVEQLSTDFALTVTN